MKQIAVWIGHAERYVLRTWFPPFIGLLAALDHFIFVVPTDGVLITSAMSAPKRWVSLAFWLTVGSVVGATILAALVSSFGPSFMETLSPGIHEHSIWKMSENWINHYGIWALFFVAALPLFQHPVIALAALAELPLEQIALAMFAGRVLKYGVIAWLASHAPDVLFKSKRIRKEVKEMDPYQES